MNLRIRTPDGAVHDIPLGPSVAVPLPGYSLRGHPVVGRSGVSPTESTRRWRETVKERKAAADG